MGTENGNEGEKTGTKRWGRRARMGSSTDIWTKTENRHQIRVGGEIGTKMGMERKNMNLHKDVKNWR